MGDDVGIRALKQNASEVVARVVAGEELTVTDRGRPVARLVPLPRSPLAAMIAAGTARPARRALHDVAPPEDGPSLSAALDALRADERY